MHTGLASAFGFNFRARTPHFIHVGRWSADVTDDTFELRILSHFFNLADDRIMAARLNDSSLMRRD